MAHIDVIEQLKARFAAPLAPAARRRVVVWHDAQGEFEECFDELAAQGFDGAGCEGGLMPACEGFARPVRFVKAEDGAMFEAKRLVARGDAASDVLLYRRCPRGSLEGDWLADVELYGEQFQADYYSLLANELGIVDVDAVREALAAHKRFFAARSRVKKFAACMPQAASADDVERGVLAVAFGGSAPEAAEAPFIVRGALTLLLREGPEALGERMDKHGCREGLATFLRVAVGFGGEPYEQGSLAALASHVLLTASCGLVKAGALAGLEGRVAPAYAPYCLGVVRAWARAGAAAEEDLYQLCRLVEDECGLAARFRSLPMADYEALDVFPCADEAILSGLLSSFAQGSDRLAEAREACGRRRDLCWHGRVSCYFDLLAAVADMCEFKQAHAGGFHLAKPAEVWEAYTGDWWRMDAAYRRLCVAFDECLRAANEAVEDAARAAADWAENLYDNWYLSQTNACWAAACAPSWEDCGYVEGVPRQEDFYWRVLPGFAGSAKTCVVVVSDALRYEVARDVAAALERERGGNVKLGSMQAVFPSITECGMPALLPHQALSLAGAGVEVLADGLPTATTAQREAVLRRVEPAARALRAEDFLAMGGAERKALLKEAPLVYLYHNKIDATGEKPATEGDVFDACADTVGELAALARRICADAPAARVVVTADHGFLYTRHALGECQKLGAEDDLPASPVLRGKRHLVVAGSAGSEAAGAVGAAGEAADGAALLIRMDMGRLGGGHTGFSPREAVRFKQAGGTSRYVHGGASLQELCVPVLGFWKARSGSKGFEDTTRAGLRVLGDARRVTNSLFSVDLIQEEPAVGKVLPAAYCLVFTDASGNEVSDEVLAHADKQSANPQERVARVRFSLKAAKGFSSQEAYHLVCRDAETGAVAWREDYRIDIAFAPLDDFGF